MASFTHPKFYNTTLIYRYHSIKSINKFSILQFLIVLYTVIYHESKKSKRFFLFLQSGGQLICHHTMMILLSVYSFVILSTDDILLWWSVNLFYTFISYYVEAIVGFFVISKYALFVFVCVLPLKHICTPKLTKVVLKI